MFADNDRISGRQMYCQIVLALVGAILLFVPGLDVLQGWQGIFSCGGGFLLAALYAFYLVRLAPVYKNPVRWIGTAGSRTAGIFFAAFFVTTGGFLLRLVSDMIGTYLLTGASVYVINGVLVIACLSAGIPVVQRRGRMADVCFWILMGILGVLLVLAVAQQDWIYLDASIQVPASGLLKGSYTIFAAFSGISALPFLLSQVKGKRCKSIIGACLTLAVILAVVLLLLQGSYGSRQVQSRPWPIIALMAGIQIPGQLLFRFDPLWIALLLFLMLFAIGSTLFYSNLILERTEIRLPWYWVALAVYLISVVGWKDIYIDEIYHRLLLYVYTPGLVVVNLIVGWFGRRKKICGKNS